MNGDQVRFGRFRLDLRRRILRRDEEPIQLGSRALDILCVLASAKGNLVTKDELMARVWPGLVVEESNIHVHVSALRKALQEEQNSPSYVITVPGRGYRFVGSQLSSAAVNRKADDRPSLTLPDKPSIAVLPFANMSHDQEQECFCDGMTEDIIIELSRFSELFVIARNSSFQYKGKTADVRQIGRELGVRYVLEGSIRLGGNLVRITVQLIDAVSGANRWSERYDRQRNDVLAVQDEIARTMATILAAHVNKAEIERTLLKPPASWQAYDYYMRAAGTLASLLSTFKATELHETRRLLEYSLSIDPDYARAYATLSFTRSFAWANPVDADHLNPAALDCAYQLALKAVQLDPNLPQARAQLGMVLVWKRQHEMSIAAFERAIALNPNYTDWRFAAALVYGGQAERAIQVIQSHMRLDPFYPPLVPGWLGFAYYMLKRYNEALSALRRFVTRAPNTRAGHLWLAATYAQLGQLEEAREEVAEVMRIQPGWTIEGSGRRYSSFKFPQHEEHYFDGLRKAGLPEK